LPFVIRVALGGLEMIRSLYMYSGVHVMVYVV
jgi:hypothetical protein